MSFENEKTYSGDLKIVEVLNPDTGKIESADYWFGQSKEIIARLRYNLKDGTIRKECPFCKSKLIIKYSPKQRPFFSHTILPDDKYCWLVDELEDSERRIIQHYNQKKESEEHQFLKHFIADSLSRDPLALNVEVEKIVKGSITPHTWKKPDVRCVYNGIPLVFEVQLSNTWLEEIVKRDKFYKAEKIFILWVFNSFDAVRPNSETTKTDIFYNNPEINVFVLDADAKDKTKETSVLHLHCWFKKPYLDENDLWIKEDWDHKLVPLSALSFDSDTYRPYFQSVMNERAVLEQRLDMIIAEKQKQYEEERLRHLKAKQQQERKEAERDARLKAEREGRERKRDAKLEEDRKTRLLLAEIDKRIERLRTMNPDLNAQDLVMLEIEDLDLKIAELEAQERGKKAIRDTNEYLHFKKLLDSQTPKNNFKNLDGASMTIEEVTDYCINILRDIKLRPKIKEEQFVEFGYALALEFGERGLENFIKLGMCYNHNRWTLVAQYKKTYLINPHSDAIDIYMLWVYCFSIGVPAWFVESKD